MTDDDNVSILIINITTFHVILFQLNTQTQSGTKVGNVAIKYCY